jgi:hypothetical protein
MNGRGKEISEDCENEAHRLKRVEIETCDFANSSARSFRFFGTELTLVPIAVCEQAKLDYRQQVERCLYEADLKRPGKTF